MIARMRRDIHGHPVKCEQGRYRIAVGSLWMHQPQKILQQKYQPCRCLHSISEQATVLEDGVSGMIHYDGRALRGNPGLQSPSLHGPVIAPENNRWDTHLYNRGSSMQVNSLYSGANNT